MNHSVELLASLIDFHVSTPGVRDLPPAKKKAYQREATAKHRAALREAKESGVIEPTKAHIQTALADAALMLLAVNGPGAEQVRAVLRSVFSAHVGTPLTVEMHAKSGQLKPRLFKAI